MLSPEGKELKTIPLVEAIRDSPYATMLAVLDRPGKRGSFTAFEDDKRERDVLHTNHVEVLRSDLAAKFPLFNAGQVLLSMRHLDMIAVLDPGKGKLVWAARGPWKAQHDPAFLANGHILIFDNLGSPVGSRVLEYDPQKQAFPWSFPKGHETQFLSKERGMSQRLGNGNTLIVDSEGRQLLEATPSGELVWSCYFEGNSLSLGRRYAPGQLTFLKGGTRARH
jgi:hypothetical protein